MCVCVYVSAYINKFVIRSPSLCFHSSFSAIAGTADYNNSIIVVGAADATVAFRSDIPVNHFQIHLNVLLWM